MKVEVHPAWRPPVRRTARDRDRRTLGDRVPGRVLPPAQRPLRRAPRKTAAHRHRAARRRASRHRRRDDVAAHALRRHRQRVLRRAPRRVLGRSRRSPRAIPITRAAGGASSPAVAELPAASGAARPHGPGLEQLHAGHGEPSRRRRWPDRCAACARTCATTQLRLEATPTRLRRWIARRRWRAS